MARVTRPGGRLAVCEFSTPVVPVFSTVYKEYLMKALPKVATAVSSNPEARRLSGRVHPRLAGPGRAGPPHRGGGWSKVRWRNLTGGIVALHAAVKA